MVKLRSKNFIEKGIAVILALMLWQILSMAIGEELLLASPIMVLERLSQLIFQEDFWSSVWLSLWRIGLGFFLAFMVGSILAMLSGSFRVIENLLFPYIAVIKATPVASFIILCMFFIGSKSLSIVISFLMVLPIIYTNMLMGIKSTNKKLLEMAKVFGLSKGKIVKSLYMPSIKPYLLSAVTISLGMSFKAGIAAEIIGLPNGTIGEKLYEAKAFLQSADLFAWTFVIIVVSILFEKVIILLLKKLLKYEVANK